MEWFKIEWFWVFYYKWKRGQTERLESRVLERKTRGMRKSHKRFIVYTRVKPWKRETKETELVGKK